MTALEQLKENLREAAYPFFTDAQLTALLADAEEDVDAASYRGLLIKAEADEVNFPGLTMGSSRPYWLSLARLYRTSQTGSMERRDVR